MNNKKLMIIDGNSILNRAYYGLQGRNMLANSKGLYTNAIYGFLNIMFKYIEEENPAYLCVTFDLKAQTFRHKQYDGYKKNRKGMPEELKVQLPVMKEVLDAMNIKRLEMAGFEADDIIGTLSLDGEKSGLKPVIVTGDKDALQLVSDETRVKIPTTRGGKTETVEYDYKAFFDKYEITPTEFIDLKGLMGDSSDNIPGIPGVGEKTALTLIREYKSIDNIYANLDNITKKALKEKLTNNKELAYLSKSLATIKRDMNLGNDIEAYKRCDFDNEKLYNILRELEFKKYIDKFGLEGVVDHEVTTKNELELKLKVIETENDLKSLIKEIQAKKEFSLHYGIDINESNIEKIFGIAINLNDDQTNFIDLTGDLKEESFIESFKEIFENIEIKKYGHELKGLYLYLKKNDIKLEGIKFDTYLAGYIIDPTKDFNSIDFLGRKYLDVDLLSIEEIKGKGKSEKTLFQLEKEQVVDVISKYAMLIPNLKLELEGIISANEQEYLYYDVELPLIQVLGDMEYWGFKVNEDELNRISIILEERLDALIEQIYSMAGEEFNINSPKQLGVILFEKLELPIIKKNKTGYSTNVEVLEKLKSKHEIIEKLLEYRHLSKLKSTYVEGLSNVINSSTGKIHSRFNQTVTQTGRISSTEPNLQNIPMKLEFGREIRKAFLPSSDQFMFLGADYSQIELRVLAHITNDENMVSAFKNNEDIHAKTASRVFGVPIDEITPLIRSNAKAINFGILYGMGDYSLSKDLNITRKEAKEYIDSYLDKYPSIKEYMDNIVTDARLKGYVTTMYNRRRYLGDLNSKNFNVRSSAERIALNTPIQGAAADIIKIAMIKIYNELKNNNLKSRIILQVHDDLLIETMVDEKDIVEKILKTCMEEAADLKVPLFVEVVSGKSWYEIK